jgi:hypothetical protein
MPAFATQIGCIAILMAPNKKRHKLLNKQLYYTFAFILSGLLISTGTRESSVYRICGIDIPPETTISAKRISYIKNILE